MGGSGPTSAGPVSERARVAPRSLGCVVGLVLTSMLWVGPGRRGNRPVTWIDSYQEAIEEARWTQKPIFFGVSVRTLKSRSSI